MSVTLNEIEMQRLAGRETVDKSLSRTLTHLFRLGYFDPVETVEWCGKKNNNRPFFGPNFPPFCYVCLSRARLRKSQQRQWPPETVFY